jgi:hypothetical protein
MEAKIQFIFACQLSTTFICNCFLNTISFTTLRFFSALGKRNTHKYKYPFVLKHIDSTSVRLMYKNISNSWTAAAF